ncbi:MAG: DUF3710 domain-containing protein [Actinomycetota bacterium]|nr:DUF3710 domain-containing protein [Actinomycetota bacterium]
MFRRRRASTDEGPPAPTEDQTDTEPDGSAAADVSRGVQADAALDRAAGPWDLSEVDDPGAGGERLHLGCLWMPGVEGMELRLEVDEQTQQIVAVTAIVADGVLQVQAFAAPRTTGIWGDVRADIAQAMTAQGGGVFERQGPFGAELLVQLPGRLPDGTPALQAARFLGVDGPRWFLRGVLSGRALEDEDVAAALEQIFRQIVVVRGDAPMARGEMLALTLPPQAGPPPGAQQAAAGSGEEPADDSDAGDAGERPALRPFERGPEITEVR